MNMAAELAVDRTHWPPIGLALEWKLKA